MFLLVFFLCIPLAVFRVIEVTFLLMSYHFLLRVSVMKVELVNIVCCVLLTYVL